MLTLELCPSRLCLCPSVGSDVFEALRDLAGDRNELRSEEIGGRNESERPVKRKEFNNQIISARYENSHTCVDLGWFFDRGNLFWDGVHRIRAVFCRLFNENYSLQIGDTFVTGSERHIHICE